MESETSTSASGRKGDTSFCQLILGNPTRDEYSFLIQFFRVICALLPDRNTLCAADGTLFLRHVTQCAADEKECLSDDDKEKLTACLVNHQETLATFYEESDELLTTFSRTDEEIVHAPGDDKEAFIDRLDEEEQRAKNRLLLTVTMFLNNFFPEEQVQKMLRPPEKIAEEAKRISTRLIQSFARELRRESAKTATLPSVGVLTPVSSPALPQVTPPVPIVSFAKKVRQWEKRRIGKWGLATGFLCGILAIGALFIPIVGPVLSHGFATSGVKLILASAGTGFSAGFMSGAIGSGCYPVSVKVEEETAEKVDTTATPGSWDKMATVGILGGSVAETFSETASSSTFAVTTATAITANTLSSAPSLVPHDDDGEGDGGLRPAG